MSSVTVHFTGTTDTVVVDNWNSAELDRLMDGLAVSTDGTTNITSSEGRRVVINRGLMTFAEKKLT